MVLRSMCFVCVLWVADQLHLEEGGTFWEHVSWAQELFTLECRTCFAHQW